MFEFVVSIKDHIASLILNLRKKSIQELKQYLKKRGEKEALFLSILTIIDSIFEKIKMVKERRESEKNISWDELLTTSVDEAKDESKDELKNLIDDFIKSYKEIHGLKV